MIYLLDSNAWIGYLRGKNSHLSARIDAAAADDLCLSTVVRFELLYGAYNSARPDRNLALLNKIFPRYSILDFEESSADAAAKLRVHLEARGTPIGPYDVMIAATALANDLTLVTRNTREFARVPNLRIEDWETP